MLPVLRPSSSQSVAERLFITGGHASGFDYLRVSLATAVIFLHSKGVVGGSGLDASSSATKPVLNIGSWSFTLVAPLYQPMVWGVLMAFFALSGFLVAGSMHRSKTTAGFLLLRGLRIFPALFVESLLAMLVLGPLVTSLSLSAYFKDPLFWEYPLNIIGEIRYYLPGVFTTNPIKGVVNAQLWTIPAEMYCYLFLAALLVVQVAKNRLTVPVITAAGLVAGCGLMMLGVNDPTTWAAGAHHAQMETLVLSFAMGVSFFELKDKVLLRVDLFIISLVASFALLWGGNLQYLAAIPVTYATIYVGFLKFPNTFVNRSGDYSYGIYLYGFPIQQLVVYLMPGNKNWFLNFVIAYAISLIFAALSWHLIESKVLSKKKVIVSAVEKWLRPFSFTLPWSVWFQGKAQKGA